MIAIVAGIAPFYLTIYSTATAVSLFTGYSIPCVIIVDSNATTGCPLANASLTSSLTLKRYFSNDESSYIAYISWDVESV